SSPTSVTTRAGQSDGSVGFRLENANPSDHRGWKNETHRRPFASTVSSGDGLFGCRFGRTVCTVSRDEVE
ncbi:hypothetical protein MTR_0712s0010, partial [Medicago truncatula]